MEINGEWYVFYHRHTNGTAFSRQGCLEKIKFTADGRIPQVEMTSCGSIEEPLPGKGEYPAYLACNLFCKDESIYTDWTGSWMNNQFPKITQDGKDGDEEIGYIANMKDSATAGFKYFACRGVKTVKIKVRGYCSGEFQVKTAWDGEPLGRIKVEFSNMAGICSEIALPDGVQALYLPIGKWQCQPGLFHSGMIFKKASGHLPANGKGPRADRRKGRLILLEDKICLFRKQLGRNDYRREVGRMLREFDLDSLREQRLTC